MSASFLSDPESEMRVAMPSHRRFIMGKKLYVGNLGYGVTSAELEQMFSVHEHKVAMTLAAHPRLPPTFVQHHLN